MLDPSALERFAAFINERHRIYLKRARGDPPPWTSDKILQTYRFTNVFRELDRTTVWIRENWRVPYADHPNLWFAMAVARQINYIDTLAAIGFPETWDPARVDSTMRERKRQGNKIYTSAYMLTGTLGGDKIHQTVYKILEPLYRSPVSIPDTLEGAWQQLKPRAGFSGFMSYEVVTDWRHTRYLENAPDVMTWAHPGPGCVRGLHRLHNRNIPHLIPRTGRIVLSTGGITKKQGCEELKELLEIMNSESSPLEEHVPRPMELRDIEHCACEFDKYERARLGEGRPRQKFVEYKPCGSS